MADTLHIRHQSEDTDEDEDDEQRSEEEEKKDQEEQEALEKAAKEQVCPVVLVQARVRGIDSGSTFDFAASEDKEWMLVASGRHVEAVCVNAFSLHLFVWPGGRGQGGQGGADQGAQRLYHRVRGLPGQSTCMLTVQEDQPAVVSKSAPDPSA